jgi:hypothetical protein
MKVSEIRGLLHLLDERNARDADARHATRQIVRGIIKSPFTLSITRAVPPRRYVEPTFQLFDGKTDPVAHLGHFVHKMSLWSHEPEYDAMLCRSFASSLRNKGLDWYHKLPEGQIRDFEELSESFVERFQTGREGSKTFEDLHALRIDKGETLRAYVRRYWDLFDDVQSSLQAKLDAFKRGVRGNRPLYESLVLKPPTTVQALIRRTEKYIILEETHNRDLLEAGVRDPPKPSAASRLGDGGGNSRPDNPSPFSKNQSGSRKDSFSSRQAAKTDQKKSTEANKAGAVNVIFNEPQRRIMKAIQNKDYFQRPRPMGGNDAARRQDQFCEYHDAHGHLTKDCFVLRQHLEDLARAGHLQKYIGEKKQRNTGREKEKIPVEEVRTVSGDTINTISGIIHRSQASRKASREQMSKVMMAEKSTFRGPEEDPITIRRFAKGETPSVAFSDEDLVGVASPHTDPLVIKVRIDVQNVKRVLVDPGSSTDVIYKNLFDKLKGVTLKKMDLPLYDFLQRPSWALGTATLNVRLGPKCVPVDFVVMDSESSYNAILGREWIASMKIVPSTIHQRLKFVCAEGVVTVRGSQGSAKECFRGSVAPALTEKRPSTSSDDGIKTIQVEDPNPPKRKTDTPESPSSQRSKAKVEE